MSPAVLELLCWHGGEYLAQSPDVVEASTGDLVDVVLRGQLAVQIDTEVPDDNVTLDYRPTDLNWSKALWYSAQVEFNYQISEFRKCGKFRYIIYRIDKIALLLVMAI